MQTLGNKALFTQYIDVVNRSMGEHRDQTPWKQLFAATGNVLGDKDIGVAVYDDDPKHPNHWATIRFHDGTFDIVEQGKGDIDVAWKVQKDHLRNVVQDPKTFVDNPARLDMDWLKTRLGLA